LQNIYAGIDYWPIDKLKLNATYHFYATETKLSNYDKPLGHEISLSASYKPLKEVEISLGYTFMKGTKTMEALKRVDQDHCLNWAWLNVVVRPRFLQVRW
jgi:hypothetical protein